MQTNKFINSNDMQNLLEENGFPPFISFGNKHIRIIR